VRHPSQAERDLAVRAALRSVSTAGTAPIPRRSGSALIPLSYSQERLWFLDRLDPHGAAYNLAAAIRLIGEVNDLSLSRALDEIVARHEVLRTQFPIVDGHPVQVISANAPPALSRVDLSGLTQPFRECAAQIVAHSQGNHPFDLEREPLFRPVLIKCSSEESLLMATIHHIALDGSSIGILLRELALLYTAFCNGRPSPLSPLPIQYADYALWHRRFVHESALRSQLPYWKEQLDGISPLRFPPSKQPDRQHMSGGRAATLDVDLTFDPDAGLIAAVNRLARSCQTTPYVVLLAAFALVLRTLTGQDDFIAGTPVANRSRPELENLIGFFVNLLPIRIRLSGNPSFREHIARVRDTVVSALAAQDVPFDFLVREFGFERDSGGATPLVQAGLSLQEEFTPRHLGNLRVRRVDIDIDSPRLALMLSLREAPGGFSGTFEYSTAIFEASTIASMAAHFRSVLERALAQPEQRISELAALPDTQQAGLIAASQGPRAALPDAGIHTLFEAQVKRTPDAIAAILGDESIGYRALLQRAQSICRWLRGRRLGAEAVVAVCMNRSVDYPAALLGIAAAGAAWLPLDPSDPPERIGFMLQDSGARALLTERSLVSTMPDTTIEICCVADITAESVARNETGSLEIAGDRAAYLIYTSGTTGKPKAVVVPHRALVNTSLALCDQIRPTTGDRFLQFASLSFDTAAFQIFPALISGAAVVFAPAPSRLSHAAICALCERQNVSVLDLPAALWHQWIADLGAMAIPLPTCIRVFMTGGETCSSSRLRTWSRLTRDESLFISSYGQTEATAATVFRIAAGHAPSVVSAQIPMGRPLRNTQVYLVDRHLNVVPAGTMGEVCVAGDGLARAYLDDPARTAERFVPNPFDSRPGARMYRTGDLARRDATAETEFQGRVDQQVKIHGIRLEPGEIESILSDHPGIASAVALLREDVPGLKRLVVYYVPTQQPGPSSSEVRAWLRSRLPDRIMPSAFVCLSSIPVTSHSKIDRAALPVPEDVLSHAADPALRPRTITEDLIANVWSELLGGITIATADNFFDLGGHSLLVVQMVSRLSRLIGVEVPVRAVFENPVLAELAAAVETLRGAVNHSGPQLGAVPVPNPAPASYSQQRMWLAHRYDSGDSNYNNPEALWLRGALNAVALEQALNVVVRRHEPLRTTFDDSHGVPVQIVAPAMYIHIGIVDLSALTGSPRKAVTADWSRYEAREPFDLSTGPLLRCRLLRFAADDHVVLFTTHHVVCDGWSIGVLKHELSEAYAAGVQGRKPILPDLPVCFREFAVWERARMHAGFFDDDLRFWRERLNPEVSGFEVPTDHPRTLTGRPIPGYIPFELEARTARALRVFARRAGATFFMVMLAGYKCLLQRWTGQMDISVGTPVAGRTRKELEPLIGFFLNEVVLTTNLGGNPRFSDIVSRVRETTLEAYSHQNAPFDEVVRLCRPARSLDSGAAYKVGFNLNSTPSRELSFPGIHEVSTVDTGQRTSKFDLSAELSDDGVTVRGPIDYNQALYDTSTIQRFASQYRALLEEAAAQPERRLSDFLGVNAGTATLLATEFNEALVSD